MLLMNCWKIISIKFLHPTRNELAIDQNYTTANDQLIEIKLFPTLAIQSRYNLCTYISISYLNFQTQIFLVSFLPELKGPSLGFIGVRGRSINHQINGDGLDKAPFFLSFLCLPSPSLSFTWLLRQLENFSKSND